MGIVENRMWHGVVGWTGRCEGQGGRGGSRRWKGRLKAHSGYIGGRSRVFLEIHAKRADTRA